MDEGSSAGVSDDSTELSGDSSDASGEGRETMPASALERFSMSSLAYIESKDRSYYGRRVS
eukprot:1274897-Amorphochlora_amoeboformis.AAC.1